jgi:hypothetical protein
MVVLVGEVGEGLLAELGRSGNVSVARAPAPRAGEPGGAEPAGPRPPGTRPAGTRPAGTRPAGSPPGWEAGALAMRAAVGRSAAYVIVPDDPLVGVAAAWRAMWDVAGGPAGAVAFEERAAEALAAWRDKRFELPDYYLVVDSGQAEGTGPDLYLGPLRAARPRRVAVAGAGGGPGQAGQVLDALRSLPHGPWWPPLDELIDGARRFYAGGLAETQPPV